MKTKEKIVLKALEMMNARGYVNVGVRDIARELDISPGNLSYHFSKKEDLLLAILNRLRSQNSAIFASFETTAATLNAYLSLLEKLFHSQWQFRGVFFGNPDLNKQLHEKENFGHEENVRRRKSVIHQIFMQLRENGHLDCPGSDIQFLVDFSSLANRYWLYEAVTDDPKILEDAAIRRYLKLLSRQFSLFATKEGKDSIEAFWADRPAAES